MIFPFLVIVPGLIAIALTLGGDSTFKLPVKPDGTLNYDMTYSCGLHQSRVNGSAQPAWHFHMHF